ncbi:MAG: FAD-binding oxidoreductase [Desulfobulbaceae bacterium]|nr:FAD-binding oxidoreductase [Desulfobulbaceae bacterium]
MKFETIIIGGGVQGTAIGHYLAAKGMQVALLEKNSIAAGTSGRCDGNILVADKMPGFDSNLNKMSQDLFPTLSEEIDYDIHWTQKGSLTMAESEEEMVLAVGFCKQLNDAGIPAKILDKKEIHDDEPHLADHVPGGFEVACDGSLNPMRLAHGLARSITRKRGTILTAAEVFKIEQDTSGNHIVHSNRGPLHCEHLVCAAGVWSPAIGAMLGIDIPVRPRQGQILVSERSSYVARRKLTEFGYLAAKFEQSNYQRKVSPEMEEFGIATVFEPTREGNFLIGSSRRFAGLDVRSDSRVLRAMAQRAIQYLPIIRNIKVIRSYAGVRPYTPDHRPIISETGIPGFYVATGHEGDGIGLSLITGKLISQLIYKEEPSADLTLLSLSRFKEKTKLWDH